MADVTGAAPTAAVSGLPPSGWLLLPPQQDDGVALRCWWSRPVDRAPRAGVLVLPEVFGINAWVRSVADRLAAEGYAALVVPLFARTAPDLELGYDEAALALGRSHKERSSASTLLQDVAGAAAWLQEHLGAAGLPERPQGGVPLGCVGFCFGGHVAMLAATLPAITATADFYGAGVVSGRPGGGAPTLGLVPQIPGRLLCLLGGDDPLIPPSDQQAIGAALAESRHRLLVLEGAGHGFCCEARADYREDAARAGWQAMLELFAEALG